MKLKPFLLGLMAMLVLTLGFHQPAFAAKQAKHSSSSSTQHNKKKGHPKKVLCTNVGAEK